MSARSTSGLIGFRIPIEESLRGTHNSRLPKTSLRLRCGSLLKVSEVSMQSAPKDFHKYGLGVLKIQCLGLWLSDAQAWGRRVQGKALTIRLLNCRT